MKILYFTNQTIDRKIAREQELKIEEQTGLILDNPFYDGDQKELGALDCGGSSNLSAEEIVGRDLKKIREADGLLAYITNDRNIGSMMEIAIASFSWGKPVYIIALEDRVFNHPWIQFFANKVFHNTYEFIRFAHREWGCHLK